MWDARAESELPFFKKGMGTQATLSERRRRRLFRLWSDALGGRRAHKVGRGSGCDFSSIEKVAVRFLGGCGRSRCPGAVAPRRR